jgi:hypothetical protein
MIFWFEAFDEQWKGIDDGWGLWDLQRNARYTLCGNPAGPACNADIYAGAGYYDPPPFSTITFDSPSINYALVGFGGAEDSQVVTDPTSAANRVARVNRAATAETFAGTVVGTSGGLTVGAIPFDASNTRMAVRVYSPGAGIRVRLKVEDSTNPASSVETEAVTTTANAWETLTFDFAAPVAGTPGLNLDVTYNRLIIFFNFGVAGATAGAQTYYFDHVEFIGGGGLPVGPFSDLTFDSPGVTYTFTGFGGAEDSSLQPDPTNAANTTVRVNRSSSAETYAGTVVSTGPNLTAGTIPFSASNTRMTVRVYSPAAGIRVRLKVEDAANPSHSVETEAVTTVASAWEMLTFNFANPVSGTPALDLSYNYNRVIIFFNFGVNGATAGAQTYYFDDVLFVIGGGSGGFTTITFDQPGVTYTMTGFGGAEDATTVPDPVGGANTVARVVKSATAELWAGTTVSTGPNLSVGTIPFTATATRMTVRVYSTRAGYPVRLKVEDAADGTRSVETEAVTTVADAWETLTFDFANQVAGTAALNPAYTYNKVSIFFDFGTTGAAGGGGTFYFDDVAFN